MKRPFLLWLATGLFVVGCGTSSTNDPKKGAASGAGQQAPAQPGGNQPGGTEPGGQTAAAKIDNGSVALSPENTKIEFVGTHAPPAAPDPRTGGFKEFQGTAQVDADAKTLKSVSIEIQTESLWTEVGGRLTNHLISPDFFDAREHPTAKFESTKISPGSNGNHTITGNFTLLGNTKETSFPARVVFDSKNLWLSAQFKFDRTQWGMDKLTERVEKEVSLTVVIGEKNEPREGAGGMGGGQGRGRGGPGGPGGGRGRGGFDPQAFFSRLDADSDKKLSKEEMPERMRDNFDALDADKDGGVTLEEFQQGMRQIFQRRGGGGGGPGGRPGRPPQPGGEAPGGQNSNSQNPSGAP